MIIVHLQQMQHRQKQNAGLTAQINATPHLQTSKSTTSVSGSHIVATLLVMDMLGMQSTSLQ